MTLAEAGATRLVPGMHPTEQEVVAWQEGGGGMDRMDVVAWQDGGGGMAGWRWWHAKIEAVAWQVGARV